MSTDNNNLPAIVNGGALQTFQNNMQVDLSMVADAAIAPLEAQLDAARRKVNQEKQSISKAHSDASKAYEKACTEFERTVMLAATEKMDEELGASDGTLRYRGTTASVNVRETAVVVQTESQLIHHTDDDDEEVTEERVISQTIQRTIQQPVPEFVKTYNAERKARLKRLDELEENLVKITNAENRLPAVARQTRAVVAQQMLKETATGQQVLETLSTHQDEFMAALGLK